MGKYIVQTFDGSSDDPEMVTMELARAIEVRTPQGTSYNPLPENEGDLIMIVLVEPEVEAVVTTADENTAYTEEELDNAAAKAGKSREEYVAELQKKGSEKKDERAKKEEDRANKLADLRAKIAADKEKEEKAGEKAEAKAPKETAKAK